MLKYLILIFVIICFYSCEKGSGVKYYSFTEDELDWIYWDTLNLKSIKPSDTTYYLKYIINGKDTVLEKFGTIFGKTGSDDYEEIGSVGNIDTAFPFNLYIDIRKSETFDFSGRCNFNNSKTNQLTSTYLNLNKSQIVTINIQGKQYNNVYKWEATDNYYKDTVVIYIAPKYGFLKGTINTNKTIVEQIRN